MTEDALDPDQGIAETTQKYDLRRNFFNGIVEASFSATALLVAIRHFEASDHAKSLIAGGSCLGFLLAPGFLLLIGKSKLPVSRICALLMLGTAIGILLSATANSAWVYAGWLLLACVLAGQVPSLMVHIYSRLPLRPKGAQNIRKPDAFRRRRGRHRPDHRLGTRPGSESLQARGGGHIPVLYVHSLLSSEDSLGSLETRRGGLERISAMP